MSVDFVAKSLIINYYIIAIIHTLLCCKGHKLTLNNS